MAHDNAKPKKSQTPSEAGDATQENPDTAGTEGSQATEGSTSVSDGQAQQIAEQVREGQTDAPKKPRLPEEVPVLALENNVIFPFMVLPMHVHRPDDIKVVEQAILGDKLFLALTLKGERGERVNPEDLYRMGTTCVILQMLRMPDGSVRFLARGLSRTRVVDYTSTDPFLVAKVEYVGDEVTANPENRALFQNLRTQFLKMIDSMPQVGEEVKVIVSNVDQPGRLADMIASHLDLTKGEKQEILELLDVTKRMQRATALLAREMQVLEAAQRIQSQAGG